MKFNLLFQFLILAQLLSAQTFTEIRPVLNFDGVAASSVTFSDIDDDGDKDLLITGQNNSGELVSKLYTNDEGYFTKVTGTPFGGLRFGSIAFSDVDGDGDNDLLMTGENSSQERITKLYTNDEGSFTEVTGTPFDGLRLSSVAFSDVDDDGDDDLLITGQKNSGEPIAKLYTNDGGSFIEVTGTPFVGVLASSVAFSDVDGDGDNDLLITGLRASGEPIAKMYTNDGGSFIEVTDTPFIGVWFSSVAFSDVDGDGDNDLLITGEDSSEERISKLYTNDGGSFIEVTSTPFEGVSSSSVAFSDVDGDGDNDLLITGTNNSEERISKLYTNDGGSFTEVTDTPFDSVGTSSVAFSDVDGDGDNDLLITGEKNTLELISKLYTNDGGNFTEVTGIPLSGVRSSSVAFSDVDGDGDSDLLITGATEAFGAGLISKLYTNDGGSFTELGDNYFEGVRYSSVAFSDVDDDGDNDLLITGINSLGVSIAKLYANDEGSFTEVTGTPFDGVKFSSVAFSDVDGDGDNDLLITGENNSFELIAKLYTNDGGNFTEVTGTPFPGIGLGSVAFSDVDGDGDSDLLMTGQNSSGEQIAKLYTNDGGSFIEVVGTPFDGVWASSIAFSDVDGDGDNDLLITGSKNSSGSERISKLYTNDGGSFTEVIGTPFDGVWGSSIAFSDVDGDGDNDLLITGANSFEEPISKLYTNDGGSFTEVMDTPFEGVRFSSIAFSDMDGDGDGDLLITGENSSDELIAKRYTNDGLVSSINDLVSSTNFNFVLYPNPTTAKNLNVKFDTRRNTLITLKVFDLNGRLLSEEQRRSEIGTQTFSIGLPSLEAGSYIIQIDDGNRTESHIVVVQ